jgi:tetratricopeptide (TPR) repeat protein
MIQLKIWLLLAEVYLEIDLPHEALNCIQEAASINPMCHQIMYMVRYKHFVLMYFLTDFLSQRGQVNVHQSQWVDAKQCFLNAVSANPNHPEALRALGEAHYILGEPRLAEKILKDAVKMDPNSPNLW